MYDRVIPAQTAHRRWAESGANLGVKPSINLKIALYSKQIL